MKALVTGGGGFLGGEIVEQLLARGDEVRVLGRSRYPELEGKVETVQADVRDAAATAQACAGIDVVFHCAALPGIWGSYEQFRSINVDGTRHVIEGCRRHGVTRLVHCSSPSVVFDGGPQRGIDETAPYPARHLAHYPATKAEAEQLVLAASDERQATVAMRPHLIWGKGDNHLIPRIVARARAGKLVRVGDGTNRVDVTHVTSAAQAHLLAADRLAPGSPVAGRAYFISQGEPVRLWEFIDRILTGLGLEPVRRAISHRTAHAVGAACEAAFRLAGSQREPRMTRFLAAQLAHDHWFDIGRARRELGYEPPLSIEEGLAELVGSLVHA